MMTGYAEKVGAGRNKGALYAESDKSFDELIVGLCPSAKKLKDAGHALTISAVERITLIDADNHKWSADRCRLSVNLPDGRELAAVVDCDAALPNTWQAESVEPILAAMFAQLADA